MFLAQFFPKMSMVRKQAEGQTAKLTIPPTYLQILTRNEACRKLILATENGRRKSTED